MRQGGGYLGGRESEPIAFLDEMVRRALFGQQVTLVNIESGLPGLSSPARVTGRVGASGFAQGVVESADIHDCGNG